MYDTCAHARKSSTRALALFRTPSIQSNTKTATNAGWNWALLVAAVSQIKGNIVDLENDLRGQTRPASLCPSKKYHPACPNKIGDACQPAQLQVQGNGCSAGMTIDIRLQHLRPCQMIRHKPVPLPPPMKIQTCPPRTRTLLRWRTVQATRFHHRMQHLMDGVCKDCVH